MDETHDSGPPDAVAAEPPVAPRAPRKGWTKLSWAVILAAVAVIMGTRMLPEPAKETPPTVEGLEFKVLRLQLKLLVALGNLDAAADPEEKLKAVEKLVEGDPARALRVSAAVADLAGPKEAIKQLDALGPADRESLTADDRRALDILGRLYVDQARGAYFHPSVADDETGFLETHLGWIGELAQYPAVPDADLKKAAARAEQVEEYQERRQRVVDGASQTAIIAIVAMTADLAVLGLSLIALPVFVLLWLVGIVRVGLKTGITHGGVYAETFAIWLALYGGLLIGSELLLRDLAPILVRGVIAMPLSLLVLGWPVLRGVPWRQVREDIGWTSGRQPLAEPLAGVVSYIVNLPLLFAVLIVTVLLIGLYTRVMHDVGEKPRMPSHPAIEGLDLRDWPNIVLFFVLASVVAPVVEETMFRGVLHRQMRESLFVSHPFIGGVCSVAIVNVIFAAVHPQGLFAIPALATIACSLSLSREWRGTLIGSMVAHGLNNFLAGLFLVFLLSQ